MSSKERTSCGVNTLSQIKLITSIYLCLNASTNNLLNILRYEVGIAFIPIRFHDSLQRFGVQLYLATDWNMIRRAASYLCFWTGTSKRATNTREIRARVIAILHHAANTLILPTSRWRLCERFVIGSKLRLLGDIWKGRKACGLCGGIQTVAMYVLDQVML